MTTYLVSGPSVPMSLAEFQGDSHGRTFSDVINGAPQALRETFEVLARPEVQLRMQDAELHHDRPALSGAIREVESCPAVASVLRATGTPAEKRFRDRYKRAVGATVRMIMESNGWSKTGRKNAIGVGEHFAVAERYKQP